MSYSVNFPFFSSQISPQNITHFRLETVSTFFVLMSYAMKFRKDAFRLPRCNSINYDKFSSSRNCFLAMVKCKALTSCSLMKVRGNVVSKKLRAQSRRWWCHISQNPVAVLVYHSLAYLKRIKSRSFSCCFCFICTWGYWTELDFFWISILSKLSKSYSFENV